MEEWYGAVYFVISLLVSVSELSKVNASNYISCPFFILGASCAKLIAQKAKGMPRILFSLGKLFDGAAGEAMANLSLELYKEFKDVQSSLTEGLVFTKLLRIIPHLKLVSRCHPQNQYLQLILCLQMGKLFFGWGLVHCLEFLFRSRNKTLWISSNQEGYLPESAVSVV